MLVKLLNLFSSKSRLRITPTTSPSQNSRSAFYKHAKLYNEFAKHAVDDEYCLNFPYFDTESSISESSTGDERVIPQVPKIKDRRIYCEGILVTVVENVSDNEEIHEEYDLFEHAVAEVIENLESSPEEDKDLEERMDMLLENHKRIMELLGTPNADWLS